MSESIILKVLHGKTSHNFITYSFKTEGEKYAFIAGMNAQDGWDGWQEFESLEEIKKELSEAHDVPFEELDQFTISEEKIS